MALHLSQKNSNGSIEIDLHNELNKEEYNQVFQAFTNLSSILNLALDKKEDEDEEFNNSFVNQLPDPSLFLYLSSCPMSENGFNTLVDTVISYIDTKEPYDFFETWSVLAYKIMNNFPIRLCSSIVKGSAIDNLHSELDALGVQYDIIDADKAEILEERAKNILVEDITTPMMVKITKNIPKDIIKFEELVDVVYQQAKESDRNIIQKHIENALPIELLFDNNDHDEINAFEGELELLSVEFELYSKKESSAQNSLQDNPDNSRGLYITIKNVSSFVDKTEKYGHITSLLFKHSDKDVIPDFVHIYHNLTKTTSIKLSPFITNREYDNLLFDLDKMDVEYIVTHSPVLQPRSLPIVKDTSNKKETYYIVFDHLGEERFNEFAVKLVKNLTYTEHSPNKDVLDWMLHHNYLTIKTEITKDQVVSDLQLMREDYGISGRIVSQSERDAKKEKSLPLYSTNNEDIYIVFTKLSSNETTNDRVCQMLIDHDMIYSKHTDITTIKDWMKQSMPILLNKNLSRTDINNHIDTMKYQDRIFSKLITHDELIKDNLIISEEDLKTKKHKKENAIEKKKDLENLYVVFDKITGDETLNRKSSNLMWWIMEDRSIKSDAILEMMKSKTKIKLDPNKPLKDILLNIDGIKSFGLDLTVISDEDIIEKKEDTTKHTDPCLIVKSYPKGCNVEYLNNIISTIYKYTKLLKTKELPEDKARLQIDYALNYGAPIALVENCSSLVDQLKELSVDAKIIRAGETKQSISVEDKYFLKIESCPDDGATIWQAASIINNARSLNTKDMYEIIFSAIQKAAKTREQLSYEILAYDDGTAKKIEDKLTKIGVKCYTYLQSKYNKNEQYYIIITEYPEDLKREAWEKLLEIVQQYALKSSGTTEEQEIELLNSALGSMTPIPIVGNGDGIKEKLITLGCNCVINKSPILNYPLKVKITQDESGNPDNIEERRKITKDPKISPIILDTYSNDDDNIVRWNVAENPSTSEKTLQQMLKTDSATIRAVIAQRQDIAKEIIETLLDDKDSVVRHYASININKRANATHKQKNKDDETSITIYSYSPKTSKILQLIELLHSVRADEKETRPEIEYKIKNAQKIYIDQVLFESNDIDLRLKKMEINYRVSPQQIESVDEDDKEIIETKDMKDEEIFIKFLRFPENRKQGLSTAIYPYGDVLEETLSGILNKLSDKKLIKLSPKANIRKFVDELEKQFGKQNITYEIINSPIQSSIEKYFDNAKEDDGSIEVKFEEDEGRDIKKRLVRITSNVGHYAAFQAASELLEFNELWKFKYAENLANIIKGYGEFEILECNKNFIVNILSHHHIGYTMVKVETRAA